jgi:hypothetical protein
VTHRQRLPTLGNLSLAFACSVASTEPPESMGRTTTLSLLGMAWEDGQGALRPE